MSKLTFQSGKGEITLRKSQSLVGLKTTETRDSEEQANYVDKEVLTNLGGFNIVKLNTEDATVDDKLDEVRSRDEVEVGTHVYYAEGSNRPLVATGEIYIVFAAGVSEDEQRIVLQEYSLQLVERRAPDRVIARVTPASPNPFKVAMALQQVSLVKLAEPDIDTPLTEYEFVAPTDDLLGHEWHLLNNGFVADTNYRLKKGADAKVVDAWKRLGNMGSTSITIAVIDNGFDTTHPDLRQKVIKPYDLWSQSTVLPQGDTRFTHGTPCASVALAASNGAGIVGSSPNARFMPVNGTSFSDRATEQMFDYCIKNGADVISCSWGTTDPTFRLNTLKEEAIARAARQGRNGKGCVIVFAAGNEDLEYLNYYAAHPDVIAVSASTSQDQHASYANRGREVWVCAPSNGDWPILAARAWWDEGLSGESGNYKFWRDGRSRGQYYKHFGGTSSATPLVAGICALILSANPDLKASEVKEILQKTADKIGDPSEYTNGHSLRFGYGRINADKAVAEALRRKEGAAPVVEIPQTVSAGKGLFRFDVKRQNPQGWGVQIGAFYDYGNVLIQAEKLQRQFGEAVIVNINELNGKTVYKVVVGAFASQADALSLQKRMKDAGVGGFAKNLADLA
ncbi:MAG: S8 family serine peptidase [Saprospiraceae bacterium]|jgi:subtilisin family serine protease|nr:S8 family serine peptidase [Saprospiraceae bacterium]